MLRDNINAINLGLSSTTGMATASIGKHNIGGASINIKRDNSTEILFHLDTLDNFVEKNSIHHIDFIKIDVEGHEIEVLKGAKNVLQTHKPYIAIEILKNEIINGKSQTIELLQDLGYKYFYSPQESNAVWKKSHGLARTINALTAKFFNVSILENYQLIKINTENILSQDYSMIIGSTTEINQ